MAVSPTDKNLAWLEISGKRFNFEHPFMLRTLSESKFMSDGREFSLTQEDMSKTLSLLRFWREDGKVTKLLQYLRYKLSRFVALERFGMSRLNLLRLPQIHLLETC